MSETGVSPPGLSDVFSTVRGMAHLLGYARVSTAEQDPALQDDALRKAGFARVWTDVASGSRDDRPELAKVLEAARSRGRRGGRPPKMTPAKLRQAEQMYAAKKPITEIADVLGVGRATVYRHLVADSLGQPSTNSGT